MASSGMIEHFNGYSGEPAPLRSVGMYVSPSDHVAPPSLAQGVSRKRRHDAGLSVGDESSLPLCLQLVALYPTTTKYEDESAYIPSKKSRSGPGFSFRLTSINVEPKPYAPVQSYATIEHSRNPSYAPQYVSQEPNVRGGSTDSFYDNQIYANQQQHYYYEQPSAQQMQQYHFQQQQQQHHHQPQQQQMYQHQMMPQQQQQQQHQQHQQHQHQQRQQYQQFDTRHLIVQQQAVQNPSYEQAQVYHHQAEQGYTPQPRAASVPESPPVCFACSHPGCDKVFGDANVLSKHEKIHLNERPWVCDHEGCNKAYTDKSSLTKHKQKHSGQRPHVCEECGRAFTLFAHLSRHRLIHSGEKPHCCTVPGCEKRFVRLDDLKTHIRVHTGERPYVCPFEDCHKAFTQASALARHRRTQHVAPDQARRQVNVTHVHSDESPPSSPSSHSQRRAMGM